MLPASQEIGSPCPIPDSRAPAYAHACSESGLMSRVNPQPQAYSHACSESHPVSVSIATKCAHNTYLTEELPLGNDAKFPIAMQARLASNLLPTERAQLQLYKLQLGRGAFLAMHKLLNCHASTQCLSPVAMQGSLACKFLLIQSTP